MVNAAFVLLLIALVGIDGAPNPRLLYLVLIFGICSHPIVHLDGLNGRLSLLGIFSAAYFVSYGFMDVMNLTRGVSAETTHSPLSESEAVMIMGIVMATLGYRGALAIATRTSRNAVDRDWSPWTALTVGLVIWGIGTVTSYVWGVYIISDTTLEATKKGLASLSPVAVAAFLLAGMVQPLGILLVAYVWRTTQAKLLTPLVIAIVCVQVVLGFILNIKGTAMIGGILVIVTIVMLESRIPRLWVAAAAVFVLVAFPIFLASREEVHGNRHIARSTILENFGKILGIALAAEDRTLKSNEQPGFLERASVRGSVQMIVEKTNEGVPFQHGYTLIPLLSSFVPKIVWPEKPDVPTGRLVNRTFHVSEYEDTYISPSILGELYWNFAWPGVLLGMTIIGGLLGFLTGRFNLAEHRTVTGLLVLVVTIKQLIVAMEGTFAPEYVVWLRSLGAIGILHLAFARKKAGANASIPRSKAGRLDVSSTRPFPNLLT